MISAPVTSNGTSRRSTDTCPKSSKRSSAWLRQIFPREISLFPRDDCDLTSLIWQPQTRLVFGNHGEDADLLAHEFASLTFNPKEIKDEIYSLRGLNGIHCSVPAESSPEVDQQPVPS